MKTEIDEVIWLTEIKAVSPKDGSMKTYIGPEIKAPTYEEAQKFVDENMPWCWILGQLVSEIPCIENTLEPDWDKQKDYKEIENPDKDISNFFNS